MTIVLVFGDSVTQGFWDSEGGWADRLKRYLVKKSIANPDIYFSFFNLGISGDNSGDILERFEQETKARIIGRDEGEEVIIIFAFGSNDSLFDNKTKKHLISISEFENNLERLLKLASRHAAHIVMVGETQVDEGKVDPVPWRPSCSYKNVFVESYVKSAKRICKKHNAPFIELWNKLGNDYTKLLDDGVHPNSKGHERMFEIVRDELVRLKIIP